MEEATFVGWLKRDGDPVRPGEPLFELESDKATQAVESLDAGLLRVPADAPAPGDVVRVGALLAYLMSDGERVPEPAVTTASTADGRIRSEASDAVAAAPSVRRLARELSVPLSGVRGSGPGGRVTPEDVRGATSAAGSVDRPGRVPSTPRARRLARESGIDWRSLPGSGRGGRVREVDVRSVAETSRPSDEMEVGYVLSPRRRAIATQMRASRRRTVAVTLAMRADATNLVGLRGQFKSRDGAVPVPAFTDIVACLAARVLKTHRHMAGRWDEAAERNVLPGDDGMHIGIAVDTDQGLLVPVVRDVAGSSLSDVTDRSRSLIERARAGRLTAEEMRGAVFTITNLGAFGVEEFTPIINYPETAILGLGAVRREAVVLEGDRIASRDRIALSLTFDHCRVDGAPAARFLRDLRIAIENPAAWLV